jgi:hypothetical protein
MRMGPAQNAILGIPWFLASQQPTEAQQNSSGTLCDVFCSSSSSLQERQPTDPEMTIAEITFSRSLGVSNPDRHQIVASIKQLARE